jgi:CP family cyanate transporter-like MFS transporter
VGQTALVPESTRPLWPGRALALVAILLTAINVRTAVSVISPIIDRVQVDIPLDPVAVGVLGMLAPVAFAVSGILAPRVAARIGLESTLSVAAIAMIVGPVVRATAGSYPVLVIGGVVALGGMGFANILLPAAVKKYFPDRIGQVTSIYVTLISVGLALPPLIAAPVADTAGWRVAVGSWCVLAVAALVPWIALWVRGALARRREPALVPVAAIGSIRRSRTAWLIAGAFVVTALNNYAFFAWLPELLQDTARVTAAQSGALLALYSGIGLPVGIAAPLIAARVRNVGVLMAAFVSCFVLGYAGLLIAPTTGVVVWVILVGAGGGVFPLCLALIGLRSRSTETSAALSGFVQSFGYAFGALGPLLVGVIHDTTAGWNGPLLFLLVTCLPGFAIAFLLAKPRFVEDEVTPVRPPGARDG